MGNKLVTRKGKECTIIFEGLHFAGKRTILEKVKLLDMETTVPEIGMTEKTLSFENYRFDTEDFGGRYRRDFKFCRKDFKFRRHNLKSLITNEIIGLEVLSTELPIRPSRRYYYKNCRGYVFVVDSSDEGCMLEAKYEFQSCLKEENLKDAVFLVLANKQDKPGAANVQEVIELLGLWDDTTHNCNIFGTCATTGEGLFEAMTWLSEALIEAEEQRVLEQQAIEVSTTKPAAHSKGGPLAYLRKITASLKIACAH